MHKEILSKEQLEILPSLAKFKSEFYLVGGTAIALHIGHRKSIDYDLFKFKPINSKRILEKLAKENLDYNVTRSIAGKQLNLLIKGVSITFFNYEFEIPHETKFENYISMPSLIDLAAMKAYALGRRGKWKDYVDLYFLIKYHFTIEEISERAKIYFNDLFTTKLFRGQLSYFEGIDYSEEVEYIIPNPPTEEEIKDFLLDKATERF